MNSGVYTAVSGMRAQMDALDMLSNNLANLNTPGYKEERAFFSALRQELDDSDEVNSAVDRQKVVAGSSMNSADGSLTRTNRDLDIALTGEGFLAVETPQGVRYTRNGNLNLNVKGELSMPSGFPVLGDTGRPIGLGPGKIDINDDGEVFLNGTRVDRLKIVKFEESTTLLREGGSLMSVKDRTSEKPSEAKVRQGFLEQSNVNPINSVVSMVGIMRQFEALQKSINTVMNDLNEKSIDKLGR